MEQSKQHTLTYKQYLLLIRIVNSRACFDKRDNCFQLSQRKIAKHIKEPLTNIQRLFVKLKDNNLTANVIDAHDTTKVMLNPYYLYIGHPNNKEFNIAQYDLRSAIAAWHYIMLCESIGWIVNGVTGELIRPYNNERQYNWRNGYHSNDRTKRRDNLDKKVTAKDYLFDDTEDSE